MCVRVEGALGIHLGGKGVPGWKSLGTTELEEGVGGVMTPAIFVRGILCALIATVFCPHSPKAVA